METVIHTDDLSVYYGDTAAITNICLTVEKGEFLGIIGPNGGGKSTLLKAILGLVPVTAGNILVYGQAVKKSRIAVGYVPQFATMDRRFPISVLEVVLTGRLKAGLSLFAKYSGEDREVAYTQLKRVGIEHLAKRQISELSGGEFQKLLIARALMVHPALLLLDEPTASVDVKSREQIYHLLKELNDEMTIVLVTHDLLAISSEVKTLACLNRRLVYHGEPQLDEQIVRELYGCPVDLIAHGVPHRMLKKH
ncbi:MAG TPA: ABC transporter ATP-binding protein, partial [Lachnospiraceae bacterium]|nr:ABC transporter ATP-binding protein [Lachnospiraceae bacterium]